MRRPIHPGFHRFLRRVHAERAATVVEYAVGISFLVLVLVASVNAVGDNLSDQYSSGNEVVADASDNPPGPVDPPSDPGATPTSTTAPPATTTTSTTSTTAPFSSAGSHIASSTHTTSTSGNKWSALFTITVLNGSGEAVPDAVIAWTYTYVCKPGSTTCASALPTGGSCTTNGSGQCTPSVTGMEKANGQDYVQSVTWTYVPPMSGVTSESASLDSTETAIRP